MKYDYLFFVAYVLAFIALPLNSAIVLGVSWFVFMVAMKLQSNYMDEDIKTKLNEIDKLLNKNENSSD